MTQLFKTYLTMAQNPDSSFTKKIAQTIPKELGYIHDGKMHRVKELLLTEAVESTTLIQAEAAKTVIEGAQPSVCIRDAFPVVESPSNVFNWTVGASGSYAEEVAESTEIPGAEQDYSTRQFVMKKYGVRPRISKELFEDGMFNVIEMEMKFAGRKLENGLNRLAISHLIDSITTEEDTAGTDQGYKAIASAVGKVTGNNFIPDTIIAHPEAMSVLLSEHTPVGGNYPVGNTASTGVMSTPYGLNIYTSSIVSNGTETWGYGADEKGMIVCDSSALAATAMKRDITVESYDDPIKDMLGMSVTARYDFKYLIAEAGCLIRG